MNTLRDRAVQAHTEHRERLEAIRRDAQRRDRERAYAMLQALVDEEDAIIEPPDETDSGELGLAELQRSLVKLAERYWVLYDPIAGNAVYDTQTGDMTYYACAEEARKAAARLNEEGQK